MSSTADDQTMDTPCHAAEMDTLMAPSAQEDTAGPTPSRDEDPARTPRLEGHQGHGADSEHSEDNVISTEADYFGSITENRKSSSGFLASLTSSNLSSPLHSTYASSASLQSSSEHASGELNAPHTAEPAFGLNNAFKGVIPHVEARPQSMPVNDPPVTTYDYPQYPDQSHAALHTQGATLPHAYLQPRNSDYTARYFTASRSTDRISQTSTSISADHTPLQSPGLFQSRKRPVERTTSRSERGPSLLHPTHHARVTKETNKLIKDFDYVTGNKIMNDYEVFEKLGVGSHGAVKRARNLCSGEDVAIKIVRRYGKKGRLGRYESPEDKVRKEVAVLKQARHPHVVSLLEVIDDPEAQKVYLVLEFVKLGEIIWRTETGRDVARFEMNRMKREISGSVDEGTEADLAAMFNVNAQRASIQARKTQLERRRRAAERAHTWSRETVGEEEVRLRRLSTIEHHNAAYAEFESAADPSNDRHWSNEFGGNESDTEPQGHLRSQSSIIHCPKSASLQSHSGSERGSIKDLIPDSDTSLVGSQYGPYSTDEKSATGSDFDVPRYFNSTTPDEKWTAEENSYKFVPCMTMTQVRDAFRDTVLGLEYLHYQGIIHRDIKPANLLWTEDYRVKISDFGVSHIGKPIRDTDDEAEEPPTDLDEAYELAKTVGTPAFYAPELCAPDLFDSNRVRVRPKVTGQIDVWALGVSLYAMVYGRLPFFDETDEFAMYEKIARQEAFLSSYRLRGVDENGRLTNSNKRSPELIEYEPVDSILKDLLKRLLLKDPAKRITLREVKRHPWVLQGLDDPESWVNETDPSIHSEGKKIEVSNKDVDFALAPLNLVDRIKHGIRRLGSVVRGRDTRRRAESNAKDPSGSNSSRSATAERDGRRLSLRGDEQIFSALRASRENSDHVHPLSHSVMASPVTEKEEPFFVQPISRIVPFSQTHRPSIIDRSESTTESIRTIKPVGAMAAIPVSAPSITEEARTVPQTDSAASSSSGLSGLIGVASRRLRNSMRSRERGNTSREHSSASSRTSSAENIAASLDDPHAQPSIGFSPAVAAGHMDHSLPSDHAAYPDVPNHLSPAVVQMQAEMQAEQQQLSSMMRSYGKKTVVPFTVPSYLSKEDEAAWLADHSYSSAEQLASIGAVSSDDQIALSESYSNPSIPSTSTSTSHPDNASSMLATAETIRAASIQRKHVTSASYAADADLAQPTCDCGSSNRHYAEECQTCHEHHRMEDDEAGYHGDGDGNSSGDEDEGIIMMGSSRR